MMNRLLLTTILLCLLSGSTRAQQPLSDIDLLRSGQNATVSNAYYSRAGNDKNVMEVHHSSFIAKYNPLSLLLKGTMYTYQNVLSPQLSRSCPYEITCSNFSKQSIKTYGIVKGMFLSADRILRCNRIGILDVHPLDFNDLTGTISDSPNKYQ